MIYYRPLAQTDAACPPDAPRLAGGWCWFDRLERLERGAPGRIVGVGDVPEEVLRRLCDPRPDLAGMRMDRPRLMGVLNVTPDSFSDGGRFQAADAAVAHAQSMVLAGADILDIGGESTRPGAAEVSPDVETGRIEPVIRALTGAGVAAPISIDTRKADVASAALRAGARIVNDVSALSHDALLAQVVAETGAPLCLMHAQGDPATMQNDPRYDDVLLDVFDYLAARIAMAEAAGIRRERIIVDPGIGFGKTTEHNLALIRGLSLFHGLGCPVLLGASRKRFIGTIGRADRADQRVAGTLAVTLAGISQGVQIHRVHDITEAKQALRLWQAVTLGETT
ncbi:MAG: dihydropteroate synthase [Rhodobacteraceae bacterium]|nr:dihydropteroate synthase [Paracoccaceae bacterium]